MSEPTHLSHPIFVMGTALLRGDHTSRRLAEHLRELGPETTGTWVSHLLAHFMIHVSLVSRSSPIAAISSGSMVRWKTRPPVSACQRPPQGREEDVWCHMIYDLSTDPLLKEIGHEGPTKFSALMLLYISYLEGEKSKSLGITWHNLTCDIVLSSLV